VSTGRGGQPRTSNAGCIFILANSFIIFDALVLPQHCYCSRTPQYAMPRSAKSSGLNTQKTTRGAFPHLIPMILVLVSCSSFPVYRPASPAIIAHRGLLGHHPGQSRAHYAWRHGRKLSNNWHSRLDVARRYSPTSAAIGRCSLVLLCPSPLVYPLRQSVRCPRRPVASILGSVAAVTKQRTLAFLQCSCYVTSRCSRRAPE
jgi:hypothetical protein